MMQLEIFNMNLKIDFFKIHIKFYIKNGIYV
jgi:hypothetical protein